MENSESLRLLAREKSRIHQLGNNARSFAPGDNFDNSKTVNVGKHSRIGSVNSNTTITSDGGDVVIEKLYLVLNLEDYWKTKTPIAT